jgi:hypothetical protein
MASVTILSDNGATSGSAGLKTSGGNDGVMLLQTTTAGGTPTTAVTIDTSQNVGVGVTPSAWSGAGPVVEVGTSKGNAFRGAGTNDANVESNAYYNSGWKYATTGYANRYAAGNGNTGGHAWYNAASGTAGNAITFTQAMTLDANAKLSTNAAQSGDSGASSATRTLFQQQTSGTQATASVFTVYGIIHPSVYRTILDSSTGSGSAAPLTFSVGNSEVGRFDSSGNLLVGTTTNPAVGKLAIAGNNGVTGSAIAVTNQSGTSQYYAAAFYNNGNSVSYCGSISISGTTTQYATSSDYRLKENIVPMTGALATVAQLKPCTYSWKPTGESTQGFIAHELQEVVPECVIGEKDAVDDNGNPVYQGIDTSFLVATLTAAIQELKAEFDAYKLTHP